jgi:hypothetical protein
MAPGFWDFDAPVVAQYGVFVERLRPPSEASGAWRHVTGILRWLAAVPLAFNFVVGIIAAVAPKTPHGCVVQTYA